MYNHFDHRNYPFILRYTSPLDLEIPCPKDPKYQWVRYQTIILPTTYDDGTPVFNVPTHANPDDWWEQYIEEQAKLHEEGVEDYAMVADGIWMHISPTGHGFFNPLTDNSYLSMYDKE